MFGWFLMRVKPRSTYYYYCLIIFTRCTNFLRTKFYHFIISSEFYTFYQTVINGVFKTFKYWLLVVTDIWTPDTVT